MYWLWKWLESYNNCTFSTWKGKCLFNLLFRIPNLFRTFHDCGRGGTPSLFSPDGTSLIFYHSKFWTTCAGPENRGPPEIFHCIEIFLSFRIFQQLALALKILTVLNILFTFRNFEQLALALKNRVGPEFTVLNIYFLLFRILSSLRLPWKTEFPLKIFTVLKYFLSFMIFEQLVFALKLFTVLKYFLSFMIIEQLVFALKTEFSLNFSSRGGGHPPAPPPRTPLHPL